MYPGSNLETNWNSLKECLPDICSKNIANQRIKTKLKNIEKLNAGLKSLTLLYGLVGLLYSRATKPSNDIKKVNRDTMEDSFSNILKLVPNEGALTLCLSEIRQNAVETKTTVQPLIFCFGTEIENVNPNLFLIVFDDYKYKFSNFDVAFQVLLQMYAVFNLKYPISSKNLFEFIAYMLYDKNINLSSKSKTLVNLISKIQN